MKEQKKDKRLKTNDKFSYTMLLLVFFVFIYIVRLFTLQILDVYDFKNKGDAVSQVGKVEYAKRGNIFDRNNLPLAVSQELDSVYILRVQTEEEHKKADLNLKLAKLDRSVTYEQRTELIRKASIPPYNDREISRLAEILEISKDLIYEFINEDKEGYIYKGINKSQKDRIELLGLPYILFNNVTERYYPNNDILSSTIGFIDSNDKAQVGLESFYDEVLTGKHGYSEYFKAIQGTEIPYEKGNKLKPVDGQNLVTTLDLELQKIVSKHMKNAFFDYKPMTAVAILSNPNNGEILAIESLPNFDANKPRSIDSDIDKLFIKELPEQKVSEYLLSRWKNNSVSMLYDPGSVYKVITTAIALEADNEIKNKIYEDNGYYELADGVVIKSWRYWDPHGPQNLREALKNSSNPVYVQVANDIGKQRYIDYAKVYNFGKLSGVELTGEEEGFFPKDGQISDVDFGTMSYGHFVNTNPMQLIAAVNSTINGGKYYKPHLVKQIINNNGEITFEQKNEYVGKTISESSSAELREYMEYAATHYGLNENSVKFGAKTGTTEKYEKISIFDKSSADKIALTTSAYVFTPTDAPKYSLLIVFDEAIGEASSSTLAARIGAKILDEIEKFENNIIEPNSEINNLVKVPNFENLSIEDALELAEKSELILTTNGEVGRFHIISNQNPKSGNLIESGKNISVSTDNKIMVPNLVGIETKEVEELLRINNIPYEIEGTGKYIESQSFNQGEIINIESIKIKLITKD